MAQGGLGHRRGAHAGQLGQGELRVGLPQLGGLLELQGELLQHPSFPQGLDGLALLHGGVHGLVHVGGLAVDPAVDPVAQELLRLGVHQLHGGHRRADGGEEILHGLALLEIRNVVGLPGDLLGGVAQLPEQDGHLPAHRPVGGGQLQVVALERVGHRTARQKRPPQEGLAAVGLLQHAEVDVVGRARGVEGAQVPQQRQLVGIGDGEDLLGAVRVPLLVEGQAEGLVKQGGEPVAKGLGLGDDLHFLGGKAVAVEQHAAGLRLGAALAGELRPAELGLDFTGK